MDWFTITEADSLDFLLVGLVSKLFNKVGLKFDLENLLEFFSKTATNR